MPGYPGQGAGYPGQGAAFPGPAAAYPGPGAGYPGTGWTPPPGKMSESKGFFSSLFDFGFNSFVTPQLIKVVYILQTIGLALAALGIIILGFLFGVAIGLIALVIVAPLFFFAYLALGRIFLESFMVFFRMSDDIRHMRNTAGRL
jgi:hypothetical protein